MRLVSNEPKVVKIAATRGDLLNLIAQYDTGFQHSDEAFISTYDKDKDRLVMIVCEAGSALDGRRHGVPKELLDAVERTESCMEEAIMENGR